jgi:hypothetical protein
LIVAIHQPNYLPWMGYFSKIARSDIFVFLDDVPFSKGSYSNRVKVMGDQVTRWLSVPVSVNLGDMICDTQPAKPDWKASHISSLKNFYAKAEFFDSAWPILEEIFDDLPNGSLSLSNRFLVESICRRLRIDCAFDSSSNYETGELKGDDRLIKLLEQVSPQATYLSGKGAQNYQDPEKFLHAGFGFEYIKFSHPVYSQMSDEFAPGLSIVDVIFNVGWEQAGILVHQGN